MKSTVCQNHHKFTHIRLLRSQQFIELNLTSDIPHVQFEPGGLQSFNIETLSGHNMCCVLVRHEFLRFDSILIRSVSMWPVFILSDLIRFHPSRFYHIRAASMIFHSQWSEGQGLGGHDEIIIVWLCFNWVIFTIILAVIVMASRISRNVRHITRSNCMVWK